MLRVRDERLVEQRARADEEVAARARHLGAARRVRDARHLREVVVREHPVLGLEGAPRVDDGVVVLVVVDGHRAVLGQQVADQPDRLLPAREQRLLLLLERRDLLLVRLLRLEELGRRRLLLLHRLGDALLRDPLRLLRVVEVAARLPPLGVDLDHLVDEADVGVPVLLRLADAVRVAALVGAEEDDVEHVVSCVGVASRESKRPRRGLKNRRCGDEFGADAAWLACDEIDVGEASKVARLGL